MKLNGVKITWLGHATFRLETPAGKVILIDPFLTNNPKCPESEKTVKKVDVILCTHGHGDHVGDAVELARKFNATVVAIYELGEWMLGKGVKQVVQMSKGGTVSVGDIKVSMVHAEHSSAIEENGQVIYAGEAAGFVVEFSNGVKMYHAGDTCVFGDMAIIREIYGPEICMLPIGDHYTMGPREAAYACKLLKPKTVIPMHWGTFPVLTGKPSDLQRLVPDVEVREMKPGETIS